MEMGYLLTFTSEYLAQQNNINTL